MSPSQVSYIDSVENLIVEGGYEEAFNQILKLEKKHLKTEDKIKCLILKSNVLNKLGKYEQSLDLSLNVYEQSKNIKDSILTMDAVLNISYSLWKIGKFDDSLAIIDKHEDLVENHKQKEPHKAITQKATLLRIRGVNFHVLGKLDKALEFYQQSLELWEESDNRQEVSSTLNNMGVLCRVKGEIHKALEYYQRSLAIYEELNNEDGISTSLNNIGNLYRNQGDLERALDFYRKSQATWEKIGNQPNIALSLCNIGEIFLQQGNIGKAIEYLRKSLQLREKVGNRHEIVLTRFYIISALLDNGRTKDARKHLIHIKEIVKDETDPFLSQITRVSEAVILKTSTRIRDKAKAEEIFQEIIEEDVVDYSITIVALLNFAELLLDELRITGDTEVLAMLKTITLSLLDVSKRHNSYLLLAKTYWLQSHLALINLDLNKARSLLTQAQFIADDKGLWRLARKISSEHDVLLSQTDKWEALVEKDAPMIERLELAQLSNVMLRMIQNGELTPPKMLNEEPVLLLILAEGGIPLFFKNYHTEEQLNSYLIGGFLSAINSFSKETFSVEGSIERIKHNEFTMLTKSFEPFLFCYIMKGQTYAAMQKLEGFVYSITSSVTISNQLLKVVKTSKPLNLESSKVIEDIAVNIFPSKR